MAVELEKLYDYMPGFNKMQMRSKNIDLEMSIEKHKFMNANDIFNFPANYHGKAVHGAKLKFENGLIAQATAEKNEMFLVG